MKLFLMIFTLISACSISASQELASNKLPLAPAGVWDPQIIAAAAGDTGQFKKILDGRMIVDHADIRFINVLAIVAKVANKQPNIDLIIAKLISHERHLALLVSTEFGSLKFKV